MHSFFLVYMKSTAKKIERWKEVKRNNRRYQLSFSKEKSGPNQKGEVVQGFAMAPFKGHPKISLHE